MYNSWSERESGASGTEFILREEQISHETRKSRQLSVHVDHLEQSPPPPPPPLLLTVDDAPAESRRLLLEVESSPTQLRSEDPKAIASWPKPPEQGGGGRLVSVSSRMLRIGAVRLVMCSHTYLRYPLVVQRTCTAVTQQKKIKVVWRESAPQPHFFILEIDAITF